MGWGCKWTATLRCYACGGRFTVAEVEFDKVNGLALVFPCPSCGSRPSIAAPGGAAKIRVHKLVGLTEEPEAGRPIRVPLKLKPEWYKRLAARALPGSDAEMYLKNSRRLAGDAGYLLLCDGGGLAALARLANASRCPEAIQAMREAYLAAIAA